VVIPPTERREGRPARARFNPSRCLLKSRAKSNSRRSCISPGSSIRLAREGRLSGRAPAVRQARELRRCEFRGMWGSRHSARNARAATEAGLQPRCRSGPVSPASLSERKPRP
jgi:hypothetical protein